MTFIRIKRRLKQYSGPLIPAIYRLLLKPIRITENITTQHSSIKHLSQPNGGLFFGYHDKTPFSRDGGKVLAMFASVDQTNPAAECTPIQLGYFQKDSNGSFGNEFTLFASTSTWCWQ